MSVDFNILNSKLKNDYPSFPKLHIHGLYFYFYFTYLPPIVALLIYFPYLPHALVK